MTLHTTNMIGLLCLSIGATSLAEPLTVGPAEAPIPVAPIDRPGCELLTNSDGTYESGVAWQREGVQKPDIGAFAECFSGEVEICSVLLDLSENGGYEGQKYTVFVWDDNGGAPGAVLCMKSGIDPGEIAVWPSFSRHEAEVGPCCTPDTWWVGYWPEWPLSNAGYFLGADLNGPAGGCPLTKALGADGWEDVSRYFQETSALGIGVLAKPCDPTPALDSTWGRLKHKFGL